MANGYGDKKFPVGARVAFDDPETKKVIEGAVRKHGRDGSGVYTEIETVGGERIKTHRSMLRPA